jgi:hypothetical protein
LLSEFKLESHGLGHTSQVTMGGLADSTLPGGDLATCNTGPAV